MGVRIVSLLATGHWQPATVLLVGAAGIEPATTGLEIRCSIQLSYAPVSKIYHSCGWSIMRCRGLAPQLPVDLRFPIPARLYRLDAGLGLRADVSDALL